MDSDFLSSSICRVSIVMTMHAHPTCTKACNGGWSQDGGKARFQRNACWGTGVSQGPISNEMCVEDRDIEGLDFDEMRVV